MSWRTLFFVLAISVLAFVGCGGDGTAGARADGGAAPEPVALQSEDEHEIVFKVTVGDVALRHVEIHGRTFVEATIENWDAWGDNGQPSLPALRRAVVLPVGANVNVTVDAKMIDRLPVDGLIAPAQPPIVKLPGAAERTPFAMDESLYHADAFAIGRLAEIVDEGLVRNHRLGLLEITPVDYNPVKHELRVARELTVTVHVRDADPERDAALTARLANPIFDKLVARTVSNHGTAAHWSMFTAPAAGADYLIVYADALAGTALNDFVTLKTNDGWNVHTINVGAIGATTGAIRDYLESQYESLANLTFVLLIGNTDAIPNFVGSQTDSPPTDLYYSTYTAGTYMPDVLIGRFPVGDTVALGNMVMKIAAYESAAAGAAWKKSGAFLASNDNYTVSEGTHNFAIDSYLTPNGYNATKLYVHTYNATPAEVTTAVNAGQNFVWYSGHGDITYWADGPVYYQSDVQALTNTNYPFVASFACLTGDYTASECFAATWVRGANGASAMLASSVYSYWNEDDWFERGMSTAMFAMVDGDANQIWAGSAMDAGKYAVWIKSNHAGNAHRYFEQYNLFGDPSMMLWTD